MTELQPIDKWLLEEAYDKISYTGKLTIDYIDRHLSSSKNLKASFDQFTGINGTLYQITDALNQRFRDLKYPIHARACAYKGSPNYILFTLLEPKPRTIIRRIKIPVSLEEKRLSEQEKKEYIAFLHQAIAARREELKRDSLKRTKDIGGKVKFTEINSSTKEEKQRDEERRDEERKLLLQK